MKKKFVNLSWSAIWFAVILMVQGNRFFRDVGIGIWVLTVFGQVWASILILQARSEGGDDDSAGSGGTSPSRNPIDFRPPPVASDGDAASQPVRV